MINNTLITLFLKTLTPAFLRIFLVLLRYEKDVKMGKIYAVFPTRKKIAFEAKCSEDRVKQFLKFLSKFTDPAFIFVRQRRNPTTQKHTSNLYEMNENVFKLGVMLEGLGYFRKWGEIREEIFLKVSENENFINERWASYRQRITRGSYKKLPAIKDSSISEALKRRTSGMERSSDQFSGKKILMNSILDFIEVPHLNQAALDHANRHASLDVLRRVNYSYRYKKDRDQPIYNPSAWFLKAIDSETVFSAKLIMTRRK